MRYDFARLVCAAAVAAAWIWSPRGCTEAAELRVATFRCDVTPPLGFITFPPTFQPLERIEHPLLAKGIVLDDGQRRYVLCAIDWCTLCNSTYDLFRRKLAEGAGTDPARVAVHTVHQHTAPTADNDAYRLLVADQGPTGLPGPEVLRKDSRPAGGGREAVARPPATVRSHRRRRGQSGPRGLHPAGHRQGRKGPPPPLQPRQGQGPFLAGRAGRADRSAPEDHHPGPRR